MKVGRKRNPKALTAFPEKGVDDPLDAIKDNAVVDTRGALGAVGEIRRAPPMAVDVAIESLRPADGPTLIQENSLTQTASFIVPAANISREGANLLVAAALRAATQAGFESSVAVVDAAGSLKSFGRTDAAPAMTVDVAIDKAWTSATSGYPTHIWNGLVADPKNAPLIQLPRMMALSGGHPILFDGKLAGAIGVSGGNHEQDLNVAVAALKSAGFVD